MMPNRTSSGQPTWQDPERTQLRRCALQSTLKLIRTRMMALGLAGLPMGFASFASAQDAGGVIALPDLPFVIPLPATLSQSGDEWYSYRYDGSRTGVQPWASTLSNPANLGGLRIEWSFPKDGDCPGHAFCPPQGVGAFVASPIVVNDTVFVGSTDGYFYALDAATGAFKWRYPPPNGKDPQTGKDYKALTGSCGCGGNWTYGNYGIRSSATYANIGGQDAVIFGAPDPDAELGLGSARLFALTADKGERIWRSGIVARVSGCNICQPDPTQPNCNVDANKCLSEHHERIAFSSPLVLGNKVYVGVHDAGDDPIQQGRVSVVDLSSGTVLDLTNPSVEHPFSYLSTGTALDDGTRGGGVWNSLATGGTGVYFTTGNTRIPPCHAPYNNCTGSEPSPNHGLSMIRVDKDTGNIIWAFQPVPFKFDGDPDWAAGAAVMSTSCGELIASVQKDGWSYAVNGNGTLAWQFPATEVPFTNPIYVHGDDDYKRPGAAWNDVLVITTGGESLVPDGIRKGYDKLHALNACATMEKDRVRWIADLGPPYSSGGGYSLGAPTVTGGIVFVGTDKGHLVVLGDPKVVPGVGYRCSNVDYTTTSACPAPYVPVPIPKVLADVPMPDGGDLVNLRKEPALARGRVFVSTSGGHVYMLEATPAQCYACCDNIKGQCDDDCASPKAAECHNRCVYLDATCRAKCDRGIGCVSPEKRP
jgi:outer membrane protein assembly factor BamB